MLFAILLRATLLVVAGYFVWFAASRCEDRLRPFGKYLALWTFVLAVLYVIASLAAPALGRGGFMGHRPGMMMGRGGFGGPMGRMGMMHRGGGFMMHRGGGFMGHRPSGQGDGQNNANPSTTPSGSSSQPATTPAPSGSGK